MEIGRKWRFSCLLLGLLFLATTLQGVQGEVESEGPSESECRPYIEKALKELEETADTDTEHADSRTPTDGESQEDIPIAEGTTDDSEHDASVGEDDTDVIEPSETEQGAQILDESAESIDKEMSKTDEKASTEIEEPNEDTESKEENKEEDVASTEQADEPQTESQKDHQKITTDENSVETSQGDQHETESNEEVRDDIEVSIEHQSGEQHEINSSEQPDGNTSTEIQESIEKQYIPSLDQPSEQEHSLEIADEENGDEMATESEYVEAKHSQDATSIEIETESAGNSEESTEQVKQFTEVSEEMEEEEEEEEYKLATSAKDADRSKEETEDKSIEESEKSVEETEKSVEDSEKSVEESEQLLKESEKSTEEEFEISKEEPEISDESEEQNEKSLEDTEKPAEDTGSSEIIKETVVVEKDVKSDEGTDTIEEGTIIESTDGVKDDKSLEELVKSEESTETTDQEIEVPKGYGDQILVADEKEEEQTTESVPEEELILEIEVPENLRSRDHIDQLLKLDDYETETIINRISEVTLRDLKKLYDNAIKPLETLYKYRDLSNRHFGDSEVFSKPLVLFMGPWSGGKSSIINYLLDNEYNAMSLRTGAEPSPAYFNLLMHGEEPEVLDGTQLAADFTFAGLQKFGQGLEERLRGLKLPSKLLEKINIVEIPGILEVRKQVSRIFPFNDACQWFIDRADIIFLVYDPSKLDVGPETEAILDQLKGREHQTRIILNKADQVKPEELMRVQSALIWNISPLMSSAQPPVMYTTSLWSRPYETWAPVRLLQAQERAFLRDLRSAVDKRIENKISSARRFAVRVRNHAKMVDCYLTTYYNHKSVFGNRKQVSDQIIEHPQDYHIYEGLSTLTNISRYDLPDPDVYRDFFRLNPLYEFQQLSATCTYFRGCPINRLDVAIAYDLPEMVGKHKKMVESALVELKNES